MRGNPAKITRLSLPTSRFAIIDAATTDERSMLYALPEFMVRLDQER